MRVCRASACQVSDAAAVPFEEVLEPVARRGLDRLHDRVGAAADILSEGVFEDLGVDLVSQLAYLSGRVLFEDFAALRDGVGDHPPTGRGLYQRYVQTLRSGGWVRLLDEYAELARLIDVVTGFWLDASTELLQRLASDRSRIEAMFGGHAPTGRVTHLRSGLSDPHCGGRSVCAVIFESGLRVIYKPRDVGIERAFAGLVAWLNEQGIDPPLRSAATLERAGYGWAEFIPAGTCADAAAARRFYERAGMLAGLLDVLGATDIHYGNVVAAGDHPVVVDLETLFHPPRPAGPDVEVADDADRSVLRTGLTPFWTPAADARSYDVSALGAVSRRDTRIPHLRWSHTNSDAMALEEGTMPIPRLANGPMLDGRSLSPADFKPEILGGFASVHALLSARVADLLDSSGPLTRMAGQRTRVLMRHTVEYRRMLDDTLARACLRDGHVRRAEIERRVETLPTGPHPKSDLAVKRAEAERDALLQLDIPYFSSRPDASFLETADGARIGGWWSEPTFGQVAARLARLDPGAVDRKSRLLKTMLDLAGLERLMNSA